MEIYKKWEFTKNGNLQKQHMNLEFEKGLGVGHNPVNISVIFWKYLNLNLKFIEFVNI